MQQTIVGVFDTMQQAERAHQALLDAGFKEAAIRVDAHAGAGTSERFATREADTGFMAGVSQFFHDLFGSDDAGDYAEAVRRGSAVVSVTADEVRLAAARQALAGSGAVDIKGRAEQWRKEGYKGYQPTANAYSAEEVARERERVIPVVQEELAVGKRDVDLGRVRVVSRVVEKPVTEEVELTTQRATIERRDVDRAASAADMAAMQRGATVEVRESTEQAVVQKNARVVEEVVVGTQQTSQTQQIKETLRSNVVEVDKQGGNLKVDPVISGKWRNHYDQNLATHGRYEDFEPAYHYGSTMRGDPKFAQRDWATAQPDLQRDYATRHPQGDWRRAEPAVRYGWEQRGL